MKKITVFCAAALLAGIVTLSARSENVTDVVKRAAAASQEGRLADAKRDFELAQTMDPGNASIKMNLGFVCQRMGLDGDAAAALEKAAALDNSLAPAHNALALIYESRAMQSAPGAARFDNLRKAKDHWQGVARFTGDAAMRDMAVRHIAQIEEQLK
ncbi:MAG: hypothetical protein WC421_01015 [Elusimicrobiales bacterium]